MQISSDNALSWSAPQLIALPEMSQIGTLRELKGDRAGNWLAVWDETTTYTYYGPPYCIFGGCIRDGTKLYYAMATDQFIWNDSIVLTPGTDGYNSYNVKSVECIGPARWGVSVWNAHWDYPNELEFNASLKVLSRNESLPPREASQSKSQSNDPKLSSVYYVTPVACAGDGRGNFIVTSTLASVSGSYVGATIYRLFDGAYVGTGARMDLHGRIPNVAVAMDQQSRCAMVLGRGQYYLSNEIFYATLDASTSSLDWTLYE
jgi:hypothetical protein